jgi:hypothetical protein
MAHLTCHSFSWFTFPFACFPPVIPLQNYGGRFVSALNSEFMVFAFTGWGNWSNKTENADGRPK